MKKSLFAALLGILASTASLALPLVPENLVVTGTYLDPHPDTQLYNGAQLTTLEISFDAVVGAERYSEIIRSEDGLVSVTDPILSRSYTRHLFSGRGVRTVVVEIRAHGIGDDGLPAYGSAVVEVALSPQLEDRDQYTLTLRDRFDATVRFLDQGDWQRARVVDVDLPGNASGLFYFFAAENAEVLVKVLNGCEVNGRWWVYGAAATDLGFELELLDRATGARKRYTNPAGTSPPAVSDVGAFRCS